MVESTLNTKIIPFSKLRESDLVSLTLRSKINGVIGLHIVGSVVRLHLNFIELKHYPTGLSEIIKLDASNISEIRLKLNNKRMSKKPKTKVPTTCSFKCNSKCNCRFISQ